MQVTRNKNNEKMINFNVILLKEYKPANNVFKKLSGLYNMNDGSIIEFYKDGDLLFMKWNGQIREGFSYKGNDEFTGGIEDIAKFEVQANGEARVKLHFVTVLKKEYNLEGVKAFRY